MGKIAAYIKESKQEVGKVLWPSKRELTNLTVLVIVVSIGIGTFIGISDYAFTQIFTLFLRLRS